MRVGSYLVQRWRNQTSPPSAFSSSRMEKLRGAGTSCDGINKVLGSASVESLRLIRRAGKFRFAIPITTRDGRLSPCSRCRESDRQPASGTRHFRQATNVM
jgi:hypothetical protein